MKLNSNLRQTAIAWCQHHLNYADIKSDNDLSNYDVANYGHEFRSLIKTMVMVENAITRVQNHILTPKDCNYEINRQVYWAKNVQLEHTLDNNNAQINDHFKRYDLIKMDLERALADSKIVSALKKPQVIYNRKTHRRSFAFLSYQQSSNVRTPKLVDYDFDIKDERESLYHGDTNAMTWYKVHANFETVTTQDVLTFLTNYYQQLALHTYQLGIQREMRDGLVLENLKGHH